MGFSVHSISVLQPNNQKSIFCSRYNESALPFCNYNLKTISSIDARAQGYKCRFGLKTDFYQKRVNLSSNVHWHANYLSYRHSFKKGPFPVEMKRMIMIIKILNNRWWRWTTSWNSWWWIRWKWQNDDEDGEEGEEAGDDEMMQKLMMMKILEMMKIIMTMNMFKMTKIMMIMKMLKMMKIMMMLKMVTSWRWWRCQKCPVVMNISINIMQSDFFLSVNNICTP